MRLSEVFTQLTHGELSQLAIGGGEEGAIVPEKYPSILSHINLGLTALYKRFPLKEGRITLVIQPGMTTYPLRSVYAVNNHRSREEVRYILDTPENPYIEDIHKIERVYAAQMHELGLNDEADPYSVFTPSAQVLRLPAQMVSGSRELPDYLKTTTLEVVYRANHPIIDVGLGYFDPARIELELPYSHLEPLLLFIASRVNNPIGMANEFHSGNNYAAKYEAACQQLEQINLRVDQGSQNTRLHRNGWV